jgi:hypothetical protein
MTIALVAANVVIFLRMPVVAHTLAGQVSLGDLCTSKRSSSGGARCRAS